MADSSALRQEQEKTLQTPRRSYGLLAQALFYVFDLIYGKGRNLSKFKALEILARMPYQAWERAAYGALTVGFREPDPAHIVFDYVAESRAQQDNEQWHMLILEEMIRQKGIQENYWLYCFAPPVISFIHYHISLFLYLMNPKWGYGVNADFEDHAEHEYMQFVKENPSFENEPFVSGFKKDYGDFKTWADVFRNIGLDERKHKDESVARMTRKRYS
jgi:ubiquinol oxidase